ncbi:hypothetical protein ACN38_g4573 [Penicillium nordicum]|uniref:Uncharacterized protein n=1 Tax=Penicillium nordicum TaxID=229535 RepID=A0A0M9WGZ9_9EURO|nr:hypothetical protein ACN38_g4573 [Penicillium nordicum]
MVNEGTNKGREKELLGVWVPEAQDPHIVSLSLRPTLSLRIYLHGFFIQSSLDSTLRALQNKPYICM